MSYKQLQKRAKELGLKYVGVSEEDLEKAIAEAEAKKPQEEKPAKEKADNKDAVVYNGNHRVRAYTLEQHGKDYKKLAEQFVSHPEREGFEVKYEEVTTRIACPHCGMKFRHP